jgi:hypothetical protein
MEQLPKNRRRVDSAGSRRRRGQQQSHLRLIKGKVASRHCTLLELIEKIQDTQPGDDEVVATIARLIESGRVVLCGTLASTPSEPSEISEPTTCHDTTPAVSTGPVRFAR